MQSIEKVEFIEVPEDVDLAVPFMRRQLLKLLPGFVLVERSDLLQEHYRYLCSKNPETQLIDAWLDFVAVKYAVPAADMVLALQDEGEVDGRQFEWQVIPKPAGGYLVPLVMGFKSISPLYQPGEVKGVRDQDVPFRFVESAYSVGEWISPHRLSSIEDILWRYHIEDDWYLGRNNYQPVQFELEI